MPMDEIAISIAPYSLQSSTEFRAGVLAYTLTKL